LLEQLLEYWYSLEFFQPNWPVREKEDFNLVKNLPPWPVKNPDPQIRASYDIYFGKAIAYDLIVWAFNNLGLIVEDSPIDRDQSKVCSCAWKVNEEGIYVPESFAISSFLWALCTMVHANDFKVNLNLDDLERFQAQFNTALIEKETPFSLPDLQSVFMQVCGKLGIPNDIAGSSIWAHRKLQYRKKDGTFPPLEPATELMSSYYVRDIACIRKNPGERVRRYAQALCDPLSQRVSVDSNTYAMQRCLQAERFPKGAWPSVYFPSLMQQLAINLADLDQSIFSVNGPPGTGKTTLLKEIVASSVVQRAALMARYASPDTAFQKQEFTNPPDKYNRTFYCPDETLTPFGILVASNNNAAVENISVELPKAISKDRTGHFVHTEHRDKAYFADIATSLLGESAWGLISARLGKKKNLSELKDRLWWANEGATLKQYYDEPQPDWKTAQRNFLAALASVEKEQARITQVQKTLEHYYAAIEAEQDEMNRLGECQVEQSKQLHLYREQQIVLDGLEGIHSAQQQNTEILKASLSWFKRLLPILFKKDPVVQEWKQIKLDAGKTLITITRQRTILQAKDQALQATQEQCRVHETARQKARAEQQRLNTLLEPKRKRFGSNFADDKFWLDICTNEDSHSACPWTDEGYDILREELFYQALMLQKAFVLNSNSVKQNLNRLFGMWDGRFSAEDRKAAYGSLLNTLFFVIPVISTTFASVHNFLDGVQPNELGILVVDESGQATPQSALGALWRTRKAIIVGDPLQVEPIMTTPLELCKRFAEDNDLPSIYRAPELSVQILADAQNPFGGLRKIGDEELWLGCPLVVHRRCTEPMFSIANQVAYENRMFCKTTPPTAGKPFLLERSTWFNVPGEEIGGKNHTVPAQIDLVAQLLEKAATQFDSLPNLYIITPFITVKHALEQKLRPLLKRLLPDIDKDETNKWLEENCGTIHTFQGKEADEVLLVLGCDTQKGISAARWVGRKPNIINVAISRAKYRVGVIGAYDLWNRIPYVQVVCDMLKESVE